jgi:hypothetical protein
LAGQGFGKFPDRTKDERNRRLPTAGLNFLRGLAFLDQSVKMKAEIAGEWFRKRLDHRQRRQRPSHLADRDGTVERDDRRRLQRFERGSTATHKAWTLLGVTPRTNDYAAFRPLGWPDRAPELPANSRKSPAWPAKLC